MSRISHPQTSPTTKQRPIADARYSAPDGFRCVCANNLTPFMHNGDRVMYCTNCKQWWRL